ncbi:arf-GAP domain and FG repeat-containing protein 1-like isoform X2 [Denticeps clupeoides]|uniref:Arf-GAP domain-containing protein n=1 Tax=Denticeps clupeoides TaxID=299321 RepID=A0AAY4C857_9TELE|nr:arf-GAP domain and FG repeat-containing protein 1-like isoform X2 [Denticeps clupeoides]
MSNRKHRDNQEVCARKVRELAQTGANRHCLECGQPGVTYIDITVGCFVCTSCSGMLRGLNPPHRVKSISMTTFSQQEVEFLQNHGNEVGKMTWLCTFDPKTDGCFDVHDSQKMKEFLQDKYEKKKWHFSKSKNRREVEGPWSPGVQSMPLAHPGPPQNLPLGHNLPPSARLMGTMSQAPLSSWDRSAAVSPADIRTDMFTARPTRSQSFRDPPVKDAMLSGLERQRPGSLSVTQNHPTSFPALPRPCGRTVSAGGGAPFRAFPKSLSLDFGGLGQQHSTLSPTPPSLALPVQDKYAALSQLDSVFCDNSSATAPSGGPPHYSTLYGNKVTSTSTRTTASSASVADPAPSGQTFANFPNPFNSASNSASSQPVLSPSNPFNSAAPGDSGAFVSSSSSSSSSSSVFPPSASFSLPSTQSAFSQEPAGKQETNGFATFPASELASKVPRPMSVNPFTGTVYPSRGTSRNPFI